MSTSTGDPTSSSAPYPKSLSPSALTRTIRPRRSVTTIASGAASRTPLNWVATVRVGSLMAARWRRGRRGGFVRSAMVLRVRAPRCHALWGGLRRAGRLTSASSHRADRPYSPSSRLALTVRGERLHPRGGRRRRVRHGRLHRVEELHAPRERAERGHDPVLLHRPQVDGDDPERHGHRS